MTEPDTLFGYSVPEPKPWHVHSPPSVHHSETSQAAAVAIHAKAPSLQPIFSCPRSTRSKASCFKASGITAVKIG